MEIDAACQMKVFGRWIGTTKSVLPAPVRRAWSYVTWNLLRIRVSALPAVMQLTLALWAALMISTLARLSSRLASVAERKLAARRQGQISLP